MLERVPNSAFENGDTDGGDSLTTPQRLVPILDQYEFALDRLVTRLEGLTDAEYHWEPTPGCWRVCRREEARTSQVAGRGDWVLEVERPAPEPAPMTTLAWRLCHLASGLTLRADYTVGSHSLSADALELPGSAAEGIAMLTTSGAAWREVLTTATDADLDQIGRSAFPWGLDPDLPLLAVTWWVNQEMLHHGGEIALLRDLYGAQVQ
jgi:hypothetical protein